MTGLPDIYDLFDQFDVRTEEQLQKVLGESGYASSTIRGPAPVSRPLLAANSPLP
jgi:hypothetical protein